MRIHLDFLSCIIRDLPAPGRVLPRGPQFPHKSAVGRLTTGSPQTKRNYAVLGGTVAMMAITVVDQR